MARKSVGMTPVRAVLEKSIRSAMATKERFKLIPSVYLILVKDGKVLLSRRFHTGFEDGKYGLVSGHAEGKATVRAELAREVQEEVNVRINPEELEHVHTMHRWCGDHERVDLFFTTSKWKGEIKNNEPNKCDDLSWFPLNELPDNVIPYVRSTIDCYLKGVQYSEFGWDR